MYVCVCINSVCLTEALQGRKTVKKPGASLDWVALHLEDLSDETLDLQEMRGKSCKYWGNKVFDREKKLICRQLMITQFVTSIVTGVAGIARCLPKPHLFFQSFS